MLILYYFKYNDDNIYILCYKIYDNIICYYYKYKYIYNIFIVLTNISIHKVLI